MKKRNVEFKLWKFIGVVAVVIITLIIILNQKNDGTIRKMANNNEDTIVVNVPEDNTTSVSLIMVGDNLIHSSVYKDAKRLAGGTGYDFKPIIEYIKEKVQNYDLAYYNQETVLGGSKLGVSDYPTFNSPQEAGDAMIDAGFNLVSLATNHTMDSGSKAVLNSRKYWDEHQDIFAVRKLWFRRKKKWACD